MTGVLTSSVGGDLSQSLYISTHHVVDFKYLTILFVNYISIKLGEKRTELKHFKKKNIFNRDFLSKVTTTIIINNSYYFYVVVLRSLRVLNHFILVTMLWK